jgi:Leucine-rich repeat (LRR) protein
VRKYGFRTDFWASTGEIKGGFLSLPWLFFGSLDKPNYMRKSIVILLLFRVLFVVAQAGGNVLKTVATLNGKPGYYAYAPYMKPVFMTPEDSTQFEQLQKWMTMKNPPIERDSIWVSQVQLLNNRVARYRPIFRGEWRIPELSAVHDSIIGNVDKVSIQNASTMDKRILKCQKLETVELVNTSFRKIPAILKKLPNLKAVYIVNNQSKKPLRTGRNKKIETLLIRHTNPNKLPNRYSKLSNLKTLDLSGTGLSEIPEQVYGCKKLSALTLKGNHITLKDAQFPANKTIEKLDLSSNYIKVVPASIGNLSGLTKILFNYNDVEIIEPGFTNLQNLTNVSLYSNNCKIFPESLYELKNLKELDLYFNEFERLDERVQNWQQLEILYLANNKLLSIPESIGSLSKLTELYLHNNRISSLPESLSELSNLRVLRINKNGLMALPTSLTRIVTLENLDISENLLSYLPEGFWGYPKLKILAMAANPWDQDLKPVINQKAADLRKNNTVVHLDEMSEDNN